MAIQADRAPGQIDRSEVVVRMRVSAQEREQYTAKARSEGRTLSNWLRWVANQASEMETEHGDQTKDA